MKIEVQYFEGCPHAKAAMDLVNRYKSEKPDAEIHFVAVEDNDHAAKIKFRGSPTILIDGEDWLDEEAPENPSLSCRFYPNGLPHYEEFKRIMEKFEK